MLNQIKSFFNQHIAPTADEQNPQASLHLACAALFVEMMYLDGAVHKQEYETILNSVGTLFSLSAAEADALIALAIQKNKDTTDYYQFTSLINKNFTQQQKVGLIKTLWQIAYADQTLDEHEEYMVRKMADLLHVSHLEFIKTKQQAGTAEPNQK